MRRAAPLALLLGALACGAGANEGDTPPGTLPGPDVPVGSVPAASLDDAALLERLWRERGRDASAFAPAFLAAVPAAELARVIDEAARGFGEVESVEATSEPNRHRLLTATHAVPIDLVRDADGRIAGLLLRPAATRADSLDAALDALRADGAAVGWLLTRDGRETASRAPGRPLAIGSAFKLWVLDAYRRAVASGELAREDVVELEAAHRSHPSGLLQGAPDGMPVTLETLAVLMISLSDNTATDALVRALGRASVEAISPFEPLLLTGELFRLKADPALERRYAEGDARERRAVLEALDGTALPPADAVLDAPLPGAEWYASARELCEVIERVADEPAMGVDAGLVEREGWRAVAAKGGSERGVLNATVRLVSDGGTVWCLAATWNGAPGADGRPGELDVPARLAALAGGVARLRER